MGLRASIRARDHQLVRRRRRVAREGLDLVVVAGVVPERPLVGEVARDYVPL
jgi:hypothetical protein